MNRKLTFVQHAVGPQVGGGGWGLHSPAKNRPILQIQGSIACEGPAKGAECTAAMAVNF